MKKMVNRLTPFARQIGLYEAGIKQDAFFLLLNPLSYLSQADGIGLEPIIHNMCNCCMRLYMVRVWGFEPQRLATTEPKSVLSANSSIPAGVLVIYNIFRSRITDFKTNENIIIASHISDKIKLYCVSIKSLNVIFILLNDF